MKTQIGQYKEVSNVATNQHEMKKMVSWLGKIYRHQLEVSKTYVSEKDEAESGELNGGFLILN
jgi:hypothetical protein